MHKKEESSKEILTLGPKIVLNELNTRYIDKLEELLTLDDCKNIAIVGTYGSGKSSLLKTFLASNKKYKNKTLTVTIGSYIIDNDIQADPDNKIDIKEQILVNRVEESILKQIIYRKKSSKFPKSSLIRLDKEYLHKALFYTIMIIYLVSFCVLNYYKHFEEIDLTFNKINSMVGINGWIVIGIIIFLIFKFVIFLINKIKVKKIKFKDYEFELLSDTNSLFSRYLSEIIYYFQITKCNLIIFEDLDRFPNDVALKVIQELKELNTILNTAYAVDKIVFIYAIKDNLFENVENKNKFYDYNLSILPISTSFNSELNLIGLLKKQDVYEELSSRVIGTISKYIYDMRTLINIVNDYCLFKNITNTKNYDKLFAMVAFKNHYYDKYNSIFEDKDDIIKHNFSTSETKKKEIIADLENKKQLKNEEITKIEKENLNNCKELKELLLAQNMLKQDNNYYQIKYYYINSNENPISDFLDNNFDMSLLENNTFKLKKSNGATIQESIVFEHFGTKKEFIERYKNLKNDTTILDRLKKEIEKIDSEISYINSLNVNEVFQKYYKMCNENKGDNAITEDSLLDDLIRNNFITDDYMDYITSPVIFENDNESESLMYSDSEFLMNFRQQKYSFELKLTGFKTILSIINDDLNSPYVLNYDLLHYLIKNNEEQYFNKIFNQFEKMNVVKLKFLLAFLHRHIDMCDFIFNNLKKNKYDIWQTYIENTNDILSEDAKFLFKNILCYPEYIKIICARKSLQQFFENKFAIDTNNEINEIVSNNNVKESMLIIHPRFNNIELFNPTNYDFIYKNNLYTFSKSNIEKIIQKEALDFKNIKSNEQTLSLYNYISNNLKCFCEEYYINNEIKFVDKDLIEKVIFNKNIDISIKIIVIKREKFKLKVIDNIQSELYESLVSYDRLNVVWKNIIDLYKKVENSLLFDYVTKNLNKLIDKIIPDNNLQKTNLFFKEYIMYLIKIDLNNTEKILRINSPKYEKLDKLTNEQIILLEKYNCLAFNKTIYKYLCTTLSQDERNTYIINCFNSNKSLTEIINLILTEDLELLLINNEMNNDKKIELLYSMYKKEKRSDPNQAYNNFIERMKITFKINKIIKISYNKTIYNAILRKIKIQGIFEIIKINEDEIKFRIN